MIRKLRRPRNRDMILWTMQPIEIWNIIQDTGVYRCDPEKSSMQDIQFVEKYEWLIEQMKKRIGPPPDGVTYPVWAWYIQNGKHKKPDLRSERWGYGPGDEEYVCIEFEVPDDHVLLSDFDVWLIILNNGLISETEEEDTRQEKYWESLSPEDQKAYEDKNWERVFDITPLNNHWIRRGDWVQATLWELRKESVRSVRFFKTGKLKEQPMKMVYFAGSIRGGREDAELYHRIIAYIKQTAFVLTEHVGDIELQENATDQTIYRQDTAWLREADLVIADCTCPSLGVGYELAYAEARGKPCHIFYNRNRTQLSAMLTGNPYFIIHPYDREEEIYPVLDEVLK